MYSILKRIRLFFLVRWYNVKDFFSVVFKFYPMSFRFMFIDLMLLLSYFFKSPYRISRQYEEEKGKKQIPPYGETPLRTMEKIVKKIKLSKNTIFYELGAGRGRSCFWLSLFTPAQIIGVEYQPEFMYRAKRLCQIFHRKNPTFLCMDMLSVDYHGVDVIYLYGSAMEDSDIQKLIHLFEKQLKKGAQIITISFSLSRYKNDVFVTKDVFYVEFPWGKTTAYIQEKL